jgi:hypothetical protein
MNMATIHRIAPASARTTTSPDTNRKPSSAEIILFPGVRYERWSETNDRSGGRTARQRDRMEIAE